MSGTEGATAGRSRTRIERRRDAARREILDAAWDLCRERGLTSLSLRDLAARVGLRAPSLYSYFSSKDDIYDAMFAQGQSDLLEALDAVSAEGSPRRRLHAGTRAFAEFCAADPVRHQLLFQRTLPGFEPSPGAYAPAVEVLDRLRRTLGDLGVTEARHVDLYTALITGLVDQQVANEPGGDRWLRLLDDAVDMYADHVGLPDPDDRRTTP